MIVSNILWHNSATSGMQIWFMDGERVARRATVLAPDGTPTFVGAPFSIVGTTDFNGDGKADILWHNSTTSGMQIWFMNGERVVRTATVLAPNGTPTFVGAPFSIVGTNDFDGDGKADILWHNSSTSEMQIWFMNGERVVRTATVLGPDGKTTFVGPPFNIVGTADFNGNGKADILWHNSTTNETQIWFMNGERVVRTATVVGENGKPIFVGLPWSIVGTSDFSANGKADILWHNSVTNEMQIWFMNDEKITRRANLVGENGNPILFGQPWSIAGTGSSFMQKLVEAKSEIARSALFSVSEINEAIHAETKSLDFAAIAAYNLNPNGTGAAIFARKEGSKGHAGFFMGDVFVTGTLGVAVDIVLANADFAEDFTVVEQTEPGEVMVLTEDGTLTQSTKAYDKKVVGILSGAGSYKPGIILDKQSNNANRKPIAMMGKVFCKVDADASPVETGDMLTTSDIPGHAMKAIDPFRAFGAVIGKALASLKEGKGLIPVLVVLQ